MKVIGITGGVGAGKSAVLARLTQRSDCGVIMADQVAHRLEEPGGRAALARPPRSINDS